ncbi:hypothetical protein V6x_08590 [Gimesia chilikensis]|uniref:Uncharacterized protein n=1 Tax=Gimesia chilikensis TaxID=2605989 RepID=A0A517W7H2_9PLAN|nr:DUF2262 domain-containing protein [Gimesia chilikensis]QDU01180.1 hypothetical protein V6x_08590 [Gimesia chilikensis]
MNDQASDAPNTDDPFAERRRKREERYAAAPVVDVLGIYVSGKGGWDESDGRATLSFKFPVWKAESNSPVHEELSVFYTTTREEYESLISLLIPYQVYLIRARVLLPTDEFDMSEARLVEFIGADTSDAGLNERVTELQKPVTYEDAQLGVFTLNRDYDLFQSKTQWKGQEIELTLNVTDLDENNAALKTAHQLWDQQDDWDKRVRQYLEQEMLPVKNDSWRDDGEAEVGVAEFRAKTELESILVNDDDSFEFWFDDGEMFGSHMLYCRGELTTGFFQASLG